MLEASRAGWEASEAEAAASEGGAPRPSTASPSRPRSRSTTSRSVDLRVAQIVEAKAVPKANKLLELTLSLGGDERRTVFAGIKKAYEPGRSSVDSRSSSRTSRRAR